MQRLLIAESAGTISKSIEDLLEADWEIYVCSNGYETADMLKYLRPTATIIDSSLLHDPDLDFLKNFSVLIGVSSPTSERIADIINAIGNTTKLVSRHLNLLGFNLNLDGSRFLIAAINLYAEQPDQRLHKELYPAIQKLCNATNATCVEHSIRTSIRSAWQKRDLSVWSQYFPQTVDEKCPSNKTFISCVAEITRKRDWL